MYRLYSLGLGLLALGYLPAFLVRKVWRAGQPAALGQRLGFLPLRPGPARIWVHAVSVGEVTAAIPLVRALRERWPAAEVVVSTVTATGQAVARQRLTDAAAVFVGPVDLPGAVRRAVRRVGPGCFIALETELWPNLLRALGQAGVPALLVNGRISDRSYWRYARVRRLFRRVLADVALFAMQSEEDARRVVSLGAPPERVVVTGNLKMEASLPEADAGRRWRACLGLGEAPVWVAGSTHRGEEEPVLDAFQALRREVPGLRLVLAPRHPERIGEVEALARARGLRPVRRSRIAADGVGDPILLDTVGELASVYGAADVVFVGGSLVPVGGHNVIEAALHARPVLFGPHMGNFREAAGLLTGSGGGIALRAAGELVPVLAALLGDPATRRARGEAAARAVRAHQGACRRTMAALEAALASASLGPAAEDPPGRSPRAEPGSRVASPSGGSSGARPPAPPGAGLAGGSSGPGGPTV